MATVSRNQRSLHISQQPMGLLAKLVAVYGREVPYERLLPPEKERGWLHTLVSRLNDSLMTLGVTVENVQGFGYRLVEATP